MNDVHINNLATDAEKGKLSGHGQHTAVLPGPLRDAAMP